MDEQQPYLMEEDTEASKRKKYIIITIILITVLIALGAAYMYLTGRGNSASPSTTNKSSSNNGNPETQKANGAKSENKYGQVTAEKKHEYKQISISVLDWLDKNKNAQGVYSYGTMCDSSNKCKNADDNRVGLAAIWAKFKFYEYTHDPKALEQVLEDIEIYLDENKVAVIQPDFWGCKFLADIGMSDRISLVQRTKVRNLCGRVNRTPNKSIAQQMTASSIQPIDINILLNQGTVVVERNTDITELVDYSIVAAESAYTYTWLKNDTLLKKANLHFNKASQAYYTKRDKTEKEEVLYRIAVLDLYRMNNDQKLKSLSEKLFLSYKHPGSCLDIEVCTLKVYYFNKLNNLFNKAEYQTYTLYLLNNLIEKNYDIKGHTGLKNDNGAFHGGTFDDYSYMTMYNSLLAGILISVK